MADSIEDKEPHKCLCSRCVTLQCGYITPCGSVEYEPFLTHWNPSVATYGSASALPSPHHPFVTVLAFVLALRDVGWVCVTPADPGGYWWPPAYSTWGPTIASFSFSVLAQLTIFSSFSGPELPEPFWGPKRRFLGIAPLVDIIPFRNDIRGESCSPQIELSNDVSCASNRDSMPKLLPWEVETPIYPNGAHSFGASSPRVRFLGCLGFSIVSQ